MTIQDELLASRTTGVLLPLSAMKTPGDWGVGDFGSLRAWTEFLAGLGIKFIQILPLQETAPGQNCPYSALTSFAVDPVYVQIDEVEDIVIRPEDLKVDTYRSSGAGGQHVNKTESAIRITHLPTGIVVACQNERSQIQNRETAMKMLYGKLQAKQEEENEAKLNSINGELKKIEWGSQIRSYVFCPYTMAKDHRTGYETSDINAVMNGDIQGFINDYLVKSHS